MTDEERTLSILAELEHDFIGYDNMQNDDAHGCTIIKTALEKTVPMEPININSVLYVDERHIWGTCPRCKKYQAVRLANYCSNCGQAFDWTGVE